MNRMALAALAALMAAACGPGEQPAQPDAAQPAITPADATPAPASAPAEAGVLTPNGLDALRIGMSLAEVEAAMGPDANPGAVGGPDPESCDQFRPENAPDGVLVMIERGTLTRISAVGDSDIKTPAGLAIGASASDVKAAYGTRAVASPHKYIEAPAEYITVWEGGPRSESFVEDESARGLVYEVDGSGNVSAIHAGGPSIQYVEGCL